MTTTPDEEVNQLLGDDPTPNDSTPDAPYGIGLNGKPRKRPGRPVGAKKAAPAAPKPPGATRTASRPSPRSTDYRAGVKGLLQLVATPLVIAGAKKPELLADGIAVEMHGDNLANALNETAKHVPQVAAALDKILAAGPYGLIIAAIIPLGAQIAVNHGFIPAQAAEAMGCVSRETLIASVTGQVPQEAQPE